MSEGKKTNKRKVLFRYLILAACILIIAAITVTTVFAVNDWFRDSGVDNVLDNPNDGKTDDNKKPEEDKKPDDSKPTDTDNTFYKPVSALYVTNGYDFLPNPSLKGQWAFHEGIDIEASAGTDVMCCLDGTVESIESNQLDGNKLTVLHKNGLKTVYTFIELKSGLKVGDSVARGEKIGTVADVEGSEFMQGAHLHFEVIEKGNSVDPTIYLDIEEK